MNTEKLYYTDPFLKEFTAMVLSCEESKNGYTVVLDSTAFYPEGGGQPADHGTLGGANLADVHVTDVHEKDGVILHTCDAPVKVGNFVVGKLDWARRFDHMQQHSGEHIISGILCDTYHCDNVGFHLGADVVTIDYNADITWEQALEAQRRANEVIWADADTEIIYPSAAELEFINYRSKKELTGQVRIVTFPEADCCACCGTHVLRAGQVGLIKVLSCQKFRDGVRIEIVCGQRALDYLNTVYEQDRTIGQKLSVKPVDTYAAVERMSDELNQLKQRAAQLEESVFAAIAAGAKDKGSVLLFQPVMKSDSVRKLADTVAHQAGDLAAVFSGEGDRFAYALVQPEGKDISAAVKAMNAALNGRGGGRNGFAQGSVQADRAAIAAFFEQEGICHAVLSD